MNATSHIALAEELLTEARVATKAAEPGSLTGANQATYLVRLAMAHTEIAKAKIMMERSDGGA